MISLFRKIRQKLLQENRVTRYLTYAFGEILLVVIGILIAMSVNNWNENRKDRVLEKKMLFEEMIALGQDLEFFNNHLLGFRIKTQANAAAFFNNYYLTGKINPDSIDFHYLRLNYSFLYSYNRGPFEAIKSAGLDKISNDSIRKNLTYLYDFIHPRWERIYEEELNPQNSETLLISKKFEQNSGFTIKNNKIIHLGPSLGSTQFIDDPDFTFLVGLADKESTQHKEDLSQVIPLMEELRGMIERELKN